MRARDVMTSPAITVTPGTTVTEADLVRDRSTYDPRYRHLHPDPESVPAASATVGAVMTTPAVGMGATADVADLVAAMWDDRVRSMPIVDGSRVIGIVTRRDLVRILARDDKDIATDVRHRLANDSGPDRWTVAVRDGVVELGAERPDSPDRHVAVVLAEAVPGVTRVLVTDTAGH